MRILMLGNSLTAANDMPCMLAELTGADVVALTRGGARLAEFANPATRMGAKTLEALEGGQWDFVVMQDMSHLPATGAQAHASSVAKVGALARAAGAVPVVYGTWAYSPACRKLGNLGMTYKEMHERMSAGSRQAALAANALLADVAAAFFNAGDPSLFAPDGVHPSPSGSLLAAHVIADVVAAGNLAVAGAAPGRRLPLSAP